MAFIRYDDRVFIGGKTGCGKSYVAEKLLAQCRYVVVLDNKGMFGYDKDTDDFYLGREGYVICTDLSEIAEIARNHEKIIYRPAAELEADKPAFMAEMDSFFWWVYNRQNCVLYVDEVTAVCDTWNILPGHNAIMKRGRQRGVGCWNSSQQPVNVHNTLLSEAEHFFIFETTLQAHREKLAGFMGEEVRRTIPKHHKYFYYNTRDMDAPVLMPPYAG